MGVSADASVRVWTRLFGTSSADAALDLGVGLDGAVYLAGYSNGSLDGQTYSGGGDAFLTKYGADGIKAWSRLLGTSASDLANTLTIGLDGSIYVAGDTEGALDGQTSGGDWDAFLTKYAIDGSKAWTRLLGSAGEDFARALATGLDGSVYVAGTTNGALDAQAYVGGTDAFLSKYSPEGVKIWTRLFGSAGSEQVRALAIGLDGAVYLCGSSDAALDGQAYGGGRDAFVVKYLADGSKAWTRLLGSASTDEAYAICVGLDASIYVAGLTRGALDGQVNSGGNDAFISKYSADGSKVWTRLLGTASSDIAYALTTGVDGSIYLGGSTEGALSGQVNAGGVDGFLSNFGPDGSMNWTRLIGGTGGESVSAMAMGLDASLYLAGGTDGTFDAQTNGGVRDAFIAKFQAKQYAIKAGATAVNEGESVRFEVTTVNVEAGTVLAYVLAGLGAADVVGGALAGSATIGSDGKAAFTVYIAADNLTEGAETLSATVQAASASVTISDSSRTPAVPSYSMAAANAYVDEGAIATFSLVAINVAAGTSISYAIAGVSSADITGGSLIGVATLNASGVATIQVPIVADGLTEGPETLILAAQGASASVIINDTSKALAAPSYILMAIGAAADEGAFASFSLSTANVAAGSSVGYSISGVSAADLTDGLLTGFVTLNSYGAAIIRLPIAADGMTEGTEILGVTVQDVAASIKVYDTSTAASGATYILTAVSEFVNEGGIASFILNTARLAAGTSLTYTISGVAAADLADGLLTGQASLNAYGAAIVQIPVAADGRTEGPETLTMTVQGASASVTINDTSKAALAPTYSLTAPSAAVDEGAVAAFTLSTTNVAPGTSVAYVLSGLSPADVRDGLLTGFVMLNADGAALVQVAIAADRLSEGTETLRVTVQGVSASVGVNDTSVAAESSAYILSALTLYVDEGSTASFTLSASGLAAGTAIPYAISGVNASDIAGGSLSGVATLNSSGAATISIPIIADGLSEGPETLVLTTQGLSASVVINDTSTAAADPSCILSPVGTSVDEGAVASFSLNTANFAAGTLLRYIVSGVTAADVVDGLLTGLATLNAYGAAIIRVPIASDVLSEGTETLSVTVQGVSASISVNDTSKAASAPSYELLAPIVAIDEGVLASFILRTSNVAPGSSIAYTLFGINAADVVGGALSGFAILNSDGVATISIPILADSLTEGSEVLRLLVQGLSASVTIHDTSTAAAMASFSLLAGAAAVDEGSTAIFSLRASNVAAGSSFVYTIAGISSNDVSGGSLVGVATLNSDGVATIQIPLLADNRTEGPEALTLSTQGLTARITVNDSSTGLPPLPPLIGTDLADTLLPRAGSETILGKAGVDTVVYANPTTSYQISKELSGFRVIATTTGDADTLDSVERLQFADQSVALDLGSGDAAGKSALLLGALLGRETMLIKKDWIGLAIGLFDAGVSMQRLAGALMRLPIWDALTGQSAPGTTAIAHYLLLTVNAAEPSASSLALAVAELNAETAQTQGAFLARLAASAANTAGIRLADLSASGLAYVSPPPAAPAPSFSLVSASATVNEGELANFLVTTSQVAAGTRIDYKISGLDAADVYGGQLQGSLEVLADGSATIQILVLADELTEGPETLVLSMEGLTASVDIADTSLTLVGVPDFGGGSDGAGSGGGGVL